VVAASHASTGHRHLDVLDAFGPSAKAA
jgi:hypothetical protein